MVTSFVLFRLPSSKAQKKFSYETSAMALRGIRYLRKLGYSVLAVSEDVERLRKEITGRRGKKV